MPLQARVKKSWKFPQVLAFSRQEYLKEEWRDVPAGFEGEAKKHPYLETRAKKAPAKAAASSLAALTVADLKKLPEWDLLDEPKPSKKGEIIEAIEAVRVMTEGDTLKPENQPPLEAIKKGEAKAPANKQSGTLG